MLTYLFGPLRNIVSVLAAHESPRQIAAGITLGCVLGMVPKGNMIAVVLMVLLFSLKVNRTAGLLTAAAFSFLSLLADPITHRLGVKILSMESMQSTYVWLYEMPLGPWIGFHNTVVMGSLLLGLYISCPVYLISKWVLVRVQPPVARWIMQYKITRWLLGADLTSRLGIPSSLGTGS